MRGALNARLDRRHAILGMAVLTLGLLAIGSSFIVGIATASRYFDRAAAAQAQLAAVAQIEAVALGGGWRDVALDRLLADYRASIDRESLVIGEPSSPGQRQEARESQRLDELAHMPGQAAALRVLIAHIATRERGEAQTVAAEMRLLRLRMVTLATVLTAGAALLALAGGWALLAANRRLQQEVALRTADLAESNAKLVEIDRSRRLFFAKTGHELRTPIAALRAEAEVALADPAPTLARHGEALDRISVQADLLGRRVEDLLALARADEGKIVLHPVPMDLASVIGQAVGHAAAHARSAEIALEVALPPMPIAVVGDPKWLVQGLLAMLDNGVKFAPSGSALTLSADRTRSAAIITISDVGPGVLPSELPRMFDAYYQTADGAARGGSGLGLALARWVIEQHGGTVTAHNDDPGCTFRITLPVAA